MRGYTESVKTMKPLSGAKLFPPVAWTSAIRARYCGWISAQHEFSRQGGISRPIESEFRVPAAIVLIKKK